VADGLDGVQVALAGRVETCWDRLDDVVSELVALHEIAPDLILRRVTDAAAAENGSAPSENAADEPPFRFR
jgi:hypothetical protein